MTTSRIFRPEEFFPGTFNGSGVLLSRFGNLLRQFILTGHAEWNESSSTLQLQESYRFDDGQIDSLNWNIQLTEARKYRGSKSSLVGYSDGVIVKNGFRWQYRRDVPDKSGALTRMTFDDMFWLQEDGSGVVHAQIKRMGITVATMAVFYIKT